MAEHSELIELRIGHIDVSIAVQSKTAVVADIRKSELFEEVSSHVQNLDPIVALSVQLPTPLPGAGSAG